MRRTTITALTLTAALGLASCGGGDDPLDPDADPGTGNGTDGGEGTAGAEDGASPGEPATGEAGTVTIGSANFAENELLAEIYAAALSDAGVEVDTRLNIGSRETYLPGLQDGSIDLIPEYLGGLGTWLNPEITATSTQDVRADVEENLPEGLMLLEHSEAENKDAIVVTEQTAQEHGLNQIGDLVDVAGEMSLGGPPEFESRPNGVAGLEGVYGVVFGSFRSLSAGGTLSVQSLASGQVDAANIFTTDPAIEENGFVVLEDPESLFAAQNVVPLASADVVDETVEQTLDAVSAALTTENLTAMMVEVLSDGQAPADVARQFVDENL
ncbi:ABC transporter substrate-binding protein [Ornithinimicrobium pratense]|uniref:ABC transporter substrate-binding protein n=2 Tax=Ornithinimicrobium pratense TaxID=2593973 RepID=A0A5J6V7K1_9MICO|nr:ABC transporter substrate-binding protein [Ornithinimicrobium pratense]